MFDMNVSQPPFNDVRVRKAMNHAVNMDLIIDKILGGFATRMAGSLLPHGYYADPDIKAYKHDQALARNSFQRLGMRKDSSGD